MFTVFIAPSSVRRTLFVTPHHTLLVCAALLLSSCTTYPPPPAAGPDFLPTLDSIEAAVRITAALLRFHPEADLEQVQRAEAAALVALDALRDLYALTYGRARHPAPAAHGHP